MCESTYIWICVYMHIVNQKKKEKKEQKEKKNVTILLNKQKR